MATILDLLMALNQGDFPPIPAPAQGVPLAPAPTGNVPEFGGPSQVTEPPQAPLDMRLIQQMLALRGPAPVAPAPLSRGQRIANALMGFSAGVEGRGGQFIEQLQQPQREYQRRLENYNQQGTELGMRGLETAQRQQERQTTRAQQVSDRQFAAEVDREARRLHLTDQRELEMFRDTMLARRQREDDERAAEEQRRREKAQRERDAIKLEGELITKDGAPSNVAKEIARRTAGLNDAPLSPAAEKWRGAQAKLADAKALRLARIAAGSGAGQGKTMAVLEGGRKVPISLVHEGHVKFGNKAIPVVDYIGGGASSPPQQAPQGFRGSLEPIGESGMLSAPVKPTLNKQQQGRFKDIKRNQPEFTDEQILQYMAKKGWLQ